MEDPPFFETQLFQWDIFNRYANVYPRVNREALETEPGLEQVVAKVPGFWIMTRVK